MKRIRFTVAGILGQGLIAGLFTTTRSQPIGREHYLQFRELGQPVIFVFWHGQLLPLIHYHRGEGVVVLVSEHGDGEYVTRVIERYGFQTARGSSTRGGLKGLRGLIRAARDGHDLALTPDGPRGPAREFKAGALVAAQMTGAAIIPMAAGASAAWHFDSWDRFMVPRPFSRIRIEYGEPVFVPRNASQSDRESLATDVQDTLNRLTDRVAVSSADGVDVRETAHPGDGS